MFKKYFLLVFPLIISCNTNSEKNTKADNSFDTLKNIYAAGFRIIKYNKYLTIEEFNPWQKAQNIAVKYRLKRQNQIIQKSNVNYINTPVKKVVCMSTTYISFIDKLGELNTIKGISGINLVSNAIIQKGIKNKEIVDVGYEQNLNYEMLISMKPDVVFTYGIGSEVSGQVAKMQELGIPVVLVSEYLETNPLAKAEWIKFFAEFFDKEEKANYIFINLSEQYDELMNKVVKINYRPTVISGLPWNGTWFVSGGNSYLAKLINDAGGNYLWKSVQSHESIPMNLEFIFQKSLYADIWINLSSATSKNDIINIDGRFKNLKPFKDDKMYNNNARINLNGGNDYWESGSVNPHIILKDLVHIFHPEINPDYQPFYYKKLK